MFEDEETSSQVVLSFELLNLIQWILEHESEGLRRLVNRSVAKGMLSSAQSNINIESAEDMQQYVVDFISTMESMMLKAVSKHIVKRTAQQKLIPAAHRIDTTTCGSSVIQFSLEKTLSQLHKKNNDNPRDLLLKELLKQWKPDKKRVLN